MTTAVKRSLFSAVNDEDHPFPRQLYLSAGYELWLRSELMLQNQRRTSGAIQKGVPTEVFLRSRVFVS